MNTMRWWLIVSLLLFTSGVRAQCSLSECQSLRRGEYVNGALLSGLTFVKPRRTWILNPSMQVETITRENDFWLADSTFWKHPPGLQFVSPRTGATLRVELYHSKDEGVVTTVTAGFHRNPKGLGLVWQRVF